MQAKGFGGKSSTVVPVPARQQIESAAERRASDEDGDVHSFVNELLILERGTHEEQEQEEGGPPKRVFVEELTLVDPRLLKSSCFLKYGSFLGLAPRVPFPIRYKSIGAASALRQGMAERNDSGVEQIQLLDGRPDSYDGVTVEMKEHMDADVFGPLLRASISSWKQQGKKGVWIKLPIEYSHLVDITVKEGFRYHHAEPNYLMLVCWLPETPDTIPANASHRVGVGAFVLNDKREVLVVQEHSGRFQGTGVWKFPTGVVNEGEDICDAVVREVKEETQVDAKFVEVLCFRQSHKSYFTKSSLFFICVLKPESSAIKKQNVEIEAAKWMPIEEYSAQPFIAENKQFNFTAKICLAKADRGYPGFAAFATTTGRGKRTHIYCNSPEIVENFASSM